MHVVVTGASGFLGAWTVRALGAAGDRVTAVSRSTSPWRLAGTTATLVAADPADWPAVVARTHADVLITADWSGVASTARGGADQWANVSRHLALIEAAAAAGIGRVVGIGSQAEYGWRDEPISEDADLRPETEYGEAKVAAGRQLEAVATRTGMDWVWARVFSVFGPLDNDGVVLARAADALASGTPLELSSGAQAWSLLFASDAGRALALLARPGTGSGVVNVAHPDAASLRASIDVFASPWTDRRALAFGESAGRSLRADTRRLESRGWAPLVGHHTALRLSSDWYRGARVLDPLDSGELPARAAGTL
jgi:UDP-glucose 4-epimerase